MTNGLCQPQDDDDDDDDGALIVAIPHGSPNGPPLLTPISQVSPWHSYLTPISQVEAPSPLSHLLPLLSLTHHLLSNIF